MFNDEGHHQREVYESIGSPAKVGLPCIAFFVSLPSYQGRRERGGEKPMFAPILHSRGEGNYLLK